MATLGTCSSGAYPKAIARAAGRSGKRQPVVWQQGSVGLAGAIEGSSAFLKSRAIEPKSNQAEISLNYQGPSIDHAKAPLDPELLEVYGFEPEGLIGDLTKPETLRLNSIENYVRYDVVSMMEGYRRSGAKQRLVT